MVLNRLDGIRVARLFLTASFCNWAEIYGQPRRHSESQKTLRCCRRKFRTLVDKTPNSWIERAGEARSARERSVAVKGSTKTSLKPEKSAVVNISYCLNECL